MGPTSSESRSHTVLIVEEVGAADSLVALEDGHA